MNTIRTLKQAFAAALLTVGVAGAQCTFTAAEANADPGCQTQTCWCPGRPLPSSHTPITWDMGVCHDWHYAWHDDPAAGDRVVDGQLDCWAIFPQCLY